MDAFRPADDLSRPAGLPRPQAAVCGVQPGAHVPEGGSAARFAPPTEEIIMNRLLDRFLRYVRVGSQADEKAATYPSSPGQLELGRLLLRELREIGLSDAEQDEHGIVLATIPATASHAAPTIAWI